MRIERSFAASLLVAWLAGPAAAQEITLVMTEEPPNLDTCQIASNTHSRILSGNVAEGLTRRVPETGELEPLLATEWERTSPTTWVFTLRDDVTFHDGTPLTAETAVTSIERTFIPELRCSIYTQAFGGTEITPSAIDEHTLQIETQSPDPILPLRASFLALAGPDTPTDAQAAEPVGTGPYRLAEWQRGSHIVLEPNPDYWGEATDVERARYVFRSEDSLRAQMVEIGEADLAVFLPPEYESMEGAIYFDSPETVALRMHTLVPPYDDIRVRKAVDRAIDRDAIIEALWGGRATPAAQMVTPDIIGFNPDLEPTPYDPEGAQELVAAAAADGAPVDREATIYVRPDLFSNADLLGEILTQQLNAIGLNVRAQAMERSPWVDILLSQQTEEPGFILELHNNVMGDASWTTNSRFHSDLPRTQIPLDLRPKVDEMIEAAREADLGPEREQLFRELFAYLAADVVQDAAIAHTGVVMMIGPRIDYTPNSQSNDIIRLTDIDVK